MRQITLFWLERPPCQSDEISAISAGVCAFSLTSRITQRDGTTGRDAPGSRTLLYPGDPGPHRPAPPRRPRASGRLPEPPAYSMIPG